MRRNSLSLLERSPCPKSLAAELLGTMPRLTMRTSKSILKNIADITETLSDFNSCAESLGESSSSSSDESEPPLDKENEGFKTMNDRKRKKKAKRRLALTPGKEQFLKKQNTKISPK